jgi:hypothetical protein
VILCGSGPSLNKVWPQLYDTKLPIAVVSTAIRVLYREGWPKPDYWLFIDSISGHHGIEGKRCMADPDVKKVIPMARYKYYQSNPNVVGCRRIGNDKMFMQETEGVAKVMNRSMTFAIQWLMKFGGHDVLIFAGMDLSSPQGRPYAHDGQLRRRLDIHNKQHQRELALLKKWSKRIDEYGVRWLSWSPGSPIEEFMETWSGCTRHNRPDGEAPRPAARVPLDT